MNQTSVLLSEDVMLHRARSAVEAAAGFEPRFAAGSGPLAELPFLAWLTGLLHPRQVIGLGLGAGAGYFTLCQTIAKANLPSEIFGIDLWRGADGLPQIPAGIEQENAAHYAGFSRLVNAAPQSAVEIFDMEEIDLLLVDLPPSEDLGRLLCEGWAPLMAERGVIVLRDAAAAAPLKAAWPYLECGGLTAVLIGRDLPPTVQALTTLSEPAWLKLVEPLRLAGEALRETQIQIEAETAAATATAAGALELEAMRARLAQAEAQIEALEAQRAADALRIEDLAGREAGLELALGQRDQAIATLSRGDALEGEAQQQAAALEEAMARRDLALARMAGQIETLTGEVTTLQASLAERSSEIVILTRMAEAQRLELEEARKTAPKSAEKIAKLTAERKEARDLLDKTAQALALKSARLAEVEPQVAGLRKAAEKVTRLTAERKEARDFLDKAVQQIALDAARIEELASQARQAAESRKAAGQAADLAAKRAVEVKEARERAEALAQRIAQEAAQNRQLADLVSEQKKVLSGRDSEISRLEAQAATELAALRAALKTAEASAAQQALRITELERSEAHGRQALIAGQAAQDHLHRALAATQAEIAGLNEGLALAQGEVTALRNSTSWKVTAPIRRMKGAARLRRPQDQPEA